MPFILSQALPFHFCLVFPDHQGRMAPCPEARCKLDQDQDQGRGRTPPVDQAEAGCSPRQASALASVLAVVALRSCRDHGRKWSDLTWRGGGGGAPSRQEDPWGRAWLVLVRAEVKVGAGWGWGWRCRWQGEESEGEE